MYNIKGVNKTVCKTGRKGSPQNIENLQKTPQNMKSLDANDNETISEPKPVFRKDPRRVSKRRRREEIITPQHEELINYIKSSWLLLSTEIEECTPSTSTESRLGNHSHSSLYYEDGPCPQLEDFKPFELELWWGRRLYNSLTKSI